MFLPPLPVPLWEGVIRTALLEDLGTAGDVTTQALLQPGQRLKATFRAREHGVLAGLEGARLAFVLLDPHSSFISHMQDGAAIKPGDVLATVDAGAETVLAGERTALNLLSHLSGIASITSQVVTAIAATKARVCCTRKTLPGLRAVQKYAVRAGGGSNHRFRLDDAILIKDNHLAIAGGIRPALTRARAAAGHLVSIELEVDTLEQLAEGLEVGGVDVFLLDNMTPDQLRQAVAMIDHRAVAEASGGVTPQNAATVAATGVDLISMGWLTHSVRAMDIGLDYQP